MPGYVFQYVPAYKNQKIMKKEEVIRICMNLQAGWSANFQVINNDECDFTCEKIERLKNDIWLCITDYGCHIIQFPCCDEADYKKGKSLREKVAKLGNMKQQYIDQVSDALMQLKSENRITQNFPEALPFLNFTETTTLMPQFDNLRALLKS